MKKSYWLIINGKKQPIYDVFDRIWIFWDKKYAKSILKTMIKRAKKKRYLVKATILWQK